VGSDLEHFGLLIIVFGRKVGMTVMTARVTQAVAWFKGCRPGRVKTTALDYAALKTGSEAACG
jgi:hypothetical protein